MTGDPTRSSTGDGDREGAEAAGAGDAAQHAYFCAAANGTQGSYDGFETWSVHVSATRSPQQQVGASLHERLHHELQHTSPWGVLGRFALDQQFVRGVARTIDGGAPRVGRGRGETLIADTDAGATRRPAGVHDAQGAGEDELTARAVKPTWIVEPGVVRGTR